MKKGKNKVLAVCFISALIAVAVFTLGVTLFLSESRPAVKVEDTTETQTTTEEKVHLVSTVTIGSAGDVLLHTPLNTAAKQSDGTYNFDNIFTYSSSLISSCDYFVANLETTLGGAEKGYTGYPCFNSPDAIVSSLKKAGVDCLLTANNHTYDTGASGVTRTVSVIENAGLANVGTRSDETEKAYIIKNVGGIKFGIACFTYETATSSAPKALNGINVSSSAAGLINSFNYEKLDEFYAELGTQLSEMESKGADVTVVYIHWGNEYQTYSSENQKQIAQALCDMGVDLIIGGHPHVVQPVELLTSADGKSKTVCVYSVGNMVSNQRRSLMNLKTGHTEDGLIFLATFSEYSDGTVTFDSVESVPTWVHLYTAGGKKVYSVVPLSENMDSASLGLDKTSSGYALAKESYERTMALVGEGTDKCNEYLSSLAKPDEEATAVPDVTAVNGEGQN